MRAVWTLWTKPMKARYGLVWDNTLSFLLSFALSFETVRRYYPETALFTDDEGARLLVEHLGLDFDYVSTEFDALDSQPVDWWNLGKLYAYRAQTDPFIHMDSDVFLWSPLPRDIEQAPVFAQNPEHFTLGASDCYFPERLQADMRAAGRGWLPEEVDWYTGLAHRERAGINCGVLGGVRVDFINHYAAAAIEFAVHPQNRAIFQTAESRRQHVVTLEQYFLSACLEYHAGREGSPFKDVRAHFLFSSFGDAYRSAEGAGYTHLIAGSKSDPYVKSRLRRRIERDYPKYLQRGLRYVERYGEFCGSMAK